MRIASEGGDSTSQPPPSAHVALVAAVSGAGSIRGRARGMADGKSRGSSAAPASVAYAAAASSASRRAVPPGSAAISMRTVSMQPLDMASSSGVRRAWSSEAEGDAPARRSARTRPSAQIRAARCSTVTPRSSAAVASDGERSSIVRTMGPSACSTVCLILLSYIVRLAFGHGTSDESSPAFRK